MELNQNRKMVLHNDVRLRGRNPLVEFLIVSVVGGIAYYATGLLATIYAPGLAMFFISDEAGLFAAWGGAIAVSYIAFLSGFLTSVLILTVVLKLLRISHPFLIVFLATLTLIPFPFLQGLLTDSPHTILNFLTIPFPLIIYAGYYGLINMRKGNFRTRLVVGVIFAGLVGIGIWQSTSFLKSQFSIERRDQRAKSLDFTAYVPSYFPGTMNPSGAHVPESTAAPYLDLDYDIEYRIKIYDDYITDYTNIYVSEFKTTDIYKPPENCGKPSPEDYYYDPEKTPCSFLMRTPLGRDIYFFRDNLGHDERLYFTIGQTTITISTYSFLTTEQLTKEELAQFVDSFREISKNELINRVLD